MFHPNNPAIPLRIRMNIHLPKHPKHRRPQNEKYPIPRTGPPEFYFGKHVDYACESGEGTDDFGIDPFGVGVFVGFARGVEVLAVETEDGEGEDELDEAEDEVEDEDWEGGGGGGEGRGGFFREAGEGHVFDIIVGEFVVL